MRRRLILCFVAPLVIAGCGSGVEPDPSLLPGLNGYSFTSNVSPRGEEVATEREYLLYVPDEYLEDPDEPWPLVLSLHGFFGTSVEFDLDTISRGLPGAFDALRYRVLLAAPLATNADMDGTDWAWLHSAEFLKEFVDHVQSRVNVDPDRVYLVGGSSGTTGVWTLAAAYPNLPAAIVTLSGGWSDRCNGCDWPADWTDNYPDGLCELAGVPTRVYHGDADMNVPWEASAAIVDALEACGGDVEFFLESGAGHDDYRPDFIEWLLAQGADGPWALQSEGASGTPSVKCSESPSGLAYSPIEDGADVRCGLVYKNAPSGAPQMLDVYAPAGADGPLPAVVFINSNGSPFFDAGAGPPFLSAREAAIEEGWRADLGTHARIAASRGLVGITFDLSLYPMYADYGEPSEQSLGYAVQDATDLLAFVTENASELNVDPERMCVWAVGSGSMVGAYLALEGEPQAECAVVFTGPLDQPYAGMYSPVSLVSADMPPFYIVRGTFDTFSNDEIDAFVFAAGEAGAEEVTVERVQAGHMFEFDASRSDVADIVDKAFNFIEESLQIGP